MIENEATIHLFINVAHPPANLIALERCPAVLFSLRYDEKSDSSMPVGISRNEIYVSCPSSSRTTPILTVVTVLCSRKLGLQLLLVDRKISTRLVLQHRPFSHRSKLILRFKYHEHAAMIRIHRTRDRSSASYHSLRSMTRRRSVTACSPPNLPASELAAR